MKSIMYRDGVGAVLEDLPTPAPGPGEAVIQVEASALCGSDLLKLDAPGHGRRVLGHEIAGHIAKLGAGVSGFSVGERVILAHHVPCGTCHYCRRNSPSMCRQFKSTNIEPGGFSEFVLASADHVRQTLLKMPEGLDSRAACLTEPLACCLRNVKRLRLEPGDCAGIIGLGSIGILTAQLLRHFKVSVFGFDTDAHRMQVARDIGLSAPEPGQAQAEILKATDGRGLDALVFTAGPATLLGERLSWVRDGGTLNIFAELRGPDAPLDVKEMYHREISLLSTYATRPEDLREALALLGSGAVDVRALTGRIYPLKDFPAAMQSFRDRSILKAIFVPS